MEKFLSLWGGFKWLTAFGAFALLQISPEENLWKYLASLGLAGVIFYFYRQDRQLSEKRYETIAQAHTQIVMDNTVAITKLTGILEQVRDRV